jgi:hypothetical protein
MRGHVGAHVLTIGGFGVAVWSVADLRIATAGMIASLVGIAWWVIAQCLEDTP